MFAGPFHNLVLAVVLFLVLLVGIGLPTTSTRIAAVPECVKPATTTSTTCTSSDTASPAARAGLRPGDRILAVDGKAIAQDPNDQGWNELVGVVQRSANEPLTLTIERNGAQRQVTVTPIENKVRTASGEVTTAGYLGIESAQVYARQPVSKVPGYFGGLITQSVQKLGEIPQRIPQVFRAAFMGAKRDPNGPIGVVGVGRISGEVFADKAFTGLDKIAMFLSLLASVNLVLFLFNLVPIYPLDGGHIAGAIYERIRAGVARVRGRPDPGPFDIARLMPVAYAVAGVFVVLSLLLVVADIVNPVTLG